MAAVSLAQPVPAQPSAAKGVAKFDFTAESEDELTLKVRVPEGRNSVKVPFNLSATAF